MNGPNVEFKLSGMKKKKKQKGSLRFQVKMFKAYTFLDYIQGGMEISMTVAIDFTGSNGHPENPQSLHYRRGGINQYQHAINAVASIILQYDHDNCVPVYGFGGKLNGQVSHCFPLTMNPNSPEVYGLQGIMDAYNKAFNHVLLSGPTYFSRIISQVSKKASEPFSSDHQHYSILLIITDGVINDMKKTIDEVVKASTKPMSIIIVGVGNANFGSMEVLDADDRALRDSKGQTAKRDIVQFVPLKDFVHKHHSMLAEAVLREVPGQVMSFAKINNVLPLGGA